MHSFKALVISSSLVSWRRIVASFLRWDFEEHVTSWLLLSLRGYFGFLELMVLMLQFRTRARKSSWACTLSWAWPSSAAWRLLFLEFLILGYGWWTYLRWSLLLRFPQGAQARSPRILLLLQAWLPSFSSSLPHPGFRTTSLCALFRRSTGGMSRKWNLPRRRNHDLGVHSSPDLAGTWLYLVLPWTTNRCWWNRRTYYRVQCFYWKVR